MNLFVINSNNSLTAKDTVLNNPNVYGVSLMLQMSTFMFGGSKFNEQRMADLIKELKRMKNAKFPKKAAISIIFGDFARNITGVSYLSFIIKRQAGNNSPVGVSSPLVWEKAYTDYVIRFIEWFSAGLKADKDAYDTVEIIKVTGLNVTTDELRIPYQDYQTKDTTDEQAKVLAAEKWLAVGYTTEKVRDAIFWIYKEFDSLFDKILVLPIVPANGFPTITDSGTIGQEPGLAQEITEQAAELGIHCGYEALNEHNVPPVWVSSYQPFYQIYAQKFGNNIQLPYPTKDQFNNVVTNAVKYNGIGLEIFEKTMSLYLS